MTKKIFNLVSDDTACYWYRSHLPQEFAGPILADEEIELITSSKIDLNEKYDAIIMHRSISPYFVPHFIEFKKQGVKLVLETDDLLTDIPDFNPAKPIFHKDTLALMRWAFGECDHVVTSTEPLKEHLGYQDKTTVLENLMEPCAIPTKKPTPIPGRILWAGSNTHRGDLDLVESALWEVLEKHPSSEMIFVGDAPENRAILRHPRVMYIPMVELAHYPKLLRTLSPQIALLPLVDCPFNESKSAIKFYEMTLFAGASCIASRVGPYLGLPVDYASTSEQWVEAIGHQIECAKTRRWMPWDQGQDCEKSRWDEASSYVTNECSWTEGNPKAMAWVDFFRGLVK